MEEEHLLTKASIPYRDPTLSSKAKDIIQKRLQEQLLSNLKTSKEWREMVEEEGQVKVQRSEQNNGSQLSFLGKSTIIKVIPSCPRIIAMKVEAIASTSPQI